LSQQEQQQPTDDSSFQNDQQKNDSGNKHEIELEINAIMENGENKIDDDIWDDFDPNANSANNIKPVSNINTNLTESVLPNSSTQPVTKSDNQRTNKMSKHDREKMYKLPSAPHIIVHQSKTAKDGKFECQLMSLSHLLDYCKDDNKESMFEVSLFAECFNEMLIRDHGFVIYKNLLKNFAEKQNEPTSSSATTTSVKRKLSITANDESNEKKAKVNETKTENSDSNNPSKQESDQNKLTTSSSAVTSNETLVKPKNKTIFPDLLLSFTYFDEYRYNYLHIKDLEGLLLCLGLTITRTKFKSLINKLTLKDDLFYYRSLTDKATVSDVQVKLPTDEEIIKSKYFLIINALYSK
jgi:hypothetical protein